MKSIHNIQFKFTAGVFVLVTAATIILGIESYKYEKRAIEDRLFAQLNAIADLKKKSVVDFLNERRNDLKMLASAVFIKKQIEIVSDGKRDKASKEIAYQYVHQRLNTFQDIYRGYRFLEITDINGKTIISSKDSETGVRSVLLDKNRTDLRDYTEAMERQGSIILESNIPDGQLQVVAALPGETGGVSGAIISYIDLSETLFPLFRDYTGLGYSGETLLVKRNGSRIIHMSPTRHAPESTAGSVFGDDYLKLSRLATSGNEGIDQGIDYRGNAVIGTYRHIPGLEWGLVTKVDLDEAFGETTALRKRIALLALAILAAMLVIVYYVVGKFSSPIIALSQKTKAIAAGRYMVVVKSGRKDEIGDLEENYNQMVAALDTARHEADLKQEDLEKMVQERTENLARANSALSKALEDIRTESAEKKSLQAQLLHAQKMEAVGTLAGGIAHDFNNILTAIIGYGNVMEMKLQPGDPLREYLTQILAASERAANLTHSLLAFSRKQVINPRPINLNEVISRVQGLLSRLMGEDIELRIMLSDAELTVMADSGQLEQVLMNLAANARDAMAAGGLLTISTEQVDIDERFVSLHGYGTIGAYAVFTVSDTGSGMDEHTRVRIFEPFFTTKDTGRGTGLGLSIVYGIIKQQSGFINCYSEPGKGTSFKIYLPRTPGLPKQEQDFEAPVPEGGAEAILLAEDSKEVRSLMKTILTQYGYKVMEAADGEEAVKIFREHRNTIRLLLFDIIMPRMNGKDAYEEIRKMQPAIKVIFTSGYTADIIHRKGFLGAGFMLLTKPLSPRELLLKLREVLDSGVSGQE